MGAPRIERGTFRMQRRKFYKYFSLRLSYAPFIRHWSICRLNMMVSTDNLKKMIVRIKDDEAIGL